MATAITRSDLVALSTYRQGRDEYLQKMIQYKKSRRLKLGQDISLLFENRQTVLFQIQELAHSEDLTDPKELDEYIDIYSGMLPGDDELSATLFIERDNQEELSKLLANLKGIEQHLFLQVGDEKLKAVFEEEHDDREFTTSVHYLKFPLTGTAKAYLTNGSYEHETVRVILDHPNLQVTTPLDADHVASLAKDLA
ncbi:DUF3501 family protein [Tumebacillus flagellatus]|uniref:DUF3501 family protein n=1 Tax=Tumebacillus flagellatus TaxID=1157490 RepID=A0A074M5R9_9BACL|nr:DUF3501 family protein [Tumebacillus flagellatus]KEO81357.1 hypothetical protein EL26_21200 [Tumebacillus flagellatus]